MVTEEKITYPSVNFTIDHILASSMILNDLKHCEKSYNVDARIDCRDADTGAWFEAIIKKVTANDIVKGRVGPRVRSNKLGYIG